MNNVNYTYFLNKNLKNMYKSIQFINNIKSFKLTNYINICKFLSYKDIKKSLEKNFRGFLIQYIYFS